MRIAIAGKGGVGKTTISATLCRLAARSGRSVLAVDGDSNPNLAAALGVDAATDHEPFLPASLVSYRARGPALSEPVDAVIDAHSSVGGDGVRLIRMGAPQHADEGCLCAAHATVSAVLGELGVREELLTVLDLEASPEHLSRGTARHADVLLLVTEPYYRSLETVRRLAALAHELGIPRIAMVANKVRSALDEEGLREFCDRHVLECVAVIPWSDAVIDADGRGSRVLDDAPDDPAVLAIAILAERLLSPSLVAPEMPR